MLNRTFGLFLLLQTGTILCEAHFLWRIDGDKPSYLYGTIHSSSPVVRDIPEAVVDVLDQAETFHPELELSPENLGKMTAALFSAPETDLQEELPEDLWNRLTRHPAAAGLPRPLLRRIPLSLLPLLLAAPPGEDFNQIVDVQLFVRAQEAGLRIHALETAEEQFSVFRDLPREASLAMVRDALEEAERGYPTLGRMLRLYRSGDVEELQRFLREEWERYEQPALEAALVDRRNRVMAERALPFIEVGGAFIAVGAAHMLGETGLVSLLREKGHTVERVPLLNPAVTR